MKEANDFRIKELEKGDAKYIPKVRILADYLDQDQEQYMPAKLRKYGEELSDCEFLDNMFKNNAKVLVCFVGDEIVGYLRSIESDYSDSAMISEIVIHEKYQSLGYGRLLLNTAIENLKLNYKSVGIYVFTHNRQAVSLYESVGLKIVSQIMFAKI